MPIITDNALFLLHLKNSILVRGAAALKGVLDDPLSRLHGRRMLIIEPAGRWKRFFPSVKFNPDWFNNRLNASLCERYFELCEQMFTQLDVKNHVVSKSRADVVVLILVDGLSYYDCIGIPEVRPCLVPGPTTTPNGFRNITQNGKIALELYAKGYRKRLGFSHWGRKGHDELANSIFYGFAPRDMHQIDEFDEVLQILSHHELDNCYIQILLEGYDQLSHRYHGRPQVDPIVRQIFEVFLSKLIREFKGRGLSCNLFLTSDHGIWWRPPAGTKSDAEVFKYNRASKMRHMVGCHFGSRFIVWERNGHSHSLLKYPFVFRKLRKNEWGVHGGVSIYESFVPFLEIEVR